MAPVDLAALGEQIMATVERVKADGPKALRRTIAELQAQLDAQPAPAPPECIDVPVIDPETVHQLDRARQAWEASPAQLRTLLEELTPSWSWLARLKDRNRGLPGRPRH